MGRSKGVHINTLAKALVLKAGYIFNTSFKHNKDVCKRLNVYTESKPELSKLAGAITRMATKAAMLNAEAAASKAANQKPAPSIAADIQTPVDAPAADVATVA